VRTPGYTGKVSFRMNITFWGFKPSKTRQVRVWNNQPYRFKAPDGTTGVFVKANGAKQWRQIAARHGFRWTFTSTLLKALSVIPPPPTPESQQVNGYPQIDGWKGNGGNSWSYVVNGASRCEVHGLDGSVTPFVPQLGTAGSVTASKSTRAWLECWENGAGPTVSEVTAQP